MQIVKIINIDRIRRRPAGGRLVGWCALSVLLVGSALTGVIAPTGAAVAAQRGEGIETEPLEPVFYHIADNTEIVMLENGLRVVLMRNPAQPMVGIYTQVKVGSAYEDFRTSGMSHMLEHLLFNGTEKYDQDQLYALADRAGAYNNAHTTDFFTNYIMVVPAGEIATGMEIQSQMLFASVIPQQKFAKEQGIVLGELVQGRDAPGHFADEVLRELLYADSCLELPTLGTRATIAHLERDDVYAFYQQWYVPNNMTLALVGNFERDEALALLDQYYGQIAPGTLAARDLIPPAHIDRTSSVVRKGGSDRLTALAFEAPGYDSADYFPFLVMTDLLAMPVTGILDRTLADLTSDERPEATIWWDRAADYGRLMMRFDLPDQFDPQRCYRLVQDAAAAAIKSHVTAEDVREIIAMRETDTLLEREQLRMTGIYIAEPLALAGLDFFVAYRERLSEVTGEEVEHMLARYLVDSPCQAVLIEPTETSLAGPGGMAGRQMPAGMQMPPAMAAAMAQARAGDQTGQPGAEGQPTAAGPPAPAGAPAIPVERTLLTSGAVLVSQTDGDSPLMAIHLTARGRAQIDRQYGAPGSVDLVHRLLTAGIDRCDEACLARRLRGLGAKVKLVDDARIPLDNYYTNGRFSFVRIEVGAANGPAVLDLLIEMTQRGDFDIDAFERAREVQAARLERNQVGARRRANLLLDEALYGDHPLVQPPEGDPQTVSELTYEQARTVYREAFAPENLIFAVISPYEHQELVTQIQQQLPGEGSPTPGVPPLPVTQASTRISESVGGQLAAIRLGSIVTVAPTDARALEILVAILSDRMAMDLRESRGLSYSVGTRVAIDGAEGEFIAWINPPRERAVEAEEAMTQFIADFAALSITQDELDRVRSARKGRAMMRRLSSISRAYYLAMAELAGDLATYVEALTSYDQITLDDLQAVDNHYLRELPLVTVVVD